MKKTNIVIERFQQVKERVRDLEQALAEPDILKDQKRYQSSSKELARLRPLVALFAEYEQIVQELSDVEALLAAQVSDPELLKLYEEERTSLIQRRGETEVILEDKLLEGLDPDADKDVIIEIRAGTGGEEAALFVRDLFRMYSRFAANHALKLEVMNTNLMGKGGFKEIIFGISGKNCYSLFRFESGTHRVQRVPETEASGRIHTSAATVAVLMEADEVDVEIKPEDLRIEVCRSGGPGGQGVNTTDSAVQIFHLPSGLMVRCQDERSQHKNKAKALRVLRARLLAMEQEKQHKAITAERRKQVGSGDRSEKIRTYNFPDNRVTDHRINFTSHALEEILEGHLEEVVSSLAKEQRLKHLEVL